MKLVRESRQGGGVNWEFRQSVASDADWMVELRAEVLRPDLERVGRFDPLRVRERFLASFNPSQTRVIVGDGVDIGLIAVRPADDGVWIEHFYLRSSAQGKGIGTAVLRRVLAEHEADVTLRLNVLQGSGALSLYKRVGFRVESVDEVDIFMVNHRGAAAMA